MLKKITQMLDLKELEASLDKALANETLESVMAWLKERDRERIIDYIGVQGYLHNLIAIQDKNTISEIAANNIQEVAFSETAGLPLAA